MTDETLALIREVAEIPTSEETPGVACDFDLDAIIIQSRRYVQMRETLVKAAGKVRAND